MAHLSISDVARRLNEEPRRITMLFYNRKLPDDLAPIVAGRRVVPEESIPAIQKALQELPRRSRGKAVAAHG